MLTQREEINRLGNLCRELLGLLASNKIDTGSLQILSDYIEEAYKQFPDQKSLKSLNEAWLALKELTSFFFSSTQDFKTREEAIKFVIHSISSFHQLNTGERISIICHSNSAKLVKKYEAIWDQKYNRYLGHAMHAVITQYCLSKKNPYLEIIKKNIYSTPLVDISYFLFHFGNHLPLREIKPDTELAAIFQVIQNKTGINILDFEKGSQLHHLLEEVIELDSGMQYTLLEMIFLNPQKFLPVLLKDKYGADQTPTIQLLLESKLINEYDLLDAIWGKNHYLDVNCMINHCNQYIFLKKNEDDNAGIFGRLIQNKQYNLAAFLFCNVHRLKLPENIATIGDSLPSLVKYICSSIEKNGEAIDNSWILILIDQLKKTQLMFINEKGYKVVNPDLCFVHLCSKKNSIRNWIDVYHRFVGYLGLKLDNSSFCSAIENIYPVTVEYIFANTDNKRFTIYAPGTYETLIKLLNSGKDLSGLLEVLKQFPLNDKDYPGDGNNKDNVLHYFKWLKERELFNAHPEVKAQVVEVYKLLVDKFYSFKNFSTFFGVNLNNGMQLPNDVMYRQIADYAIRLSK